MDHTNKENLICTINIKPETQFHLYNPETLRARNHITREQDRKLGFTAPNKYYPYFCGSEMSIGRKI